MFSMYTEHDGVGGLLGKRPGRDAASSWTSRNGSRSDVATFVIYLVPVASQAPLISIEDG